MHPASPNGEHTPRRRRIRTPLRRISPLDAPPTGELTRWRRDLLVYLRELELVVRRGGGEAYVKRRLEGLVRALENRLEQARRSG